MITFFSFRYPKIQLCSLLFPLVSLSDACTSGTLPPAAEDTQTPPSPADLDEAPIKDLTTESSATAAGARRKLFGDSTDNIQKQLSMRPCKLTWTHRKATRTLQTTASTQNQESQVDNFKRFPKRRYSQCFPS